VSQHSDVREDEGRSLTNDASDPNCGAAYVAAEDDTLLGLVDGCSQTNPSNAAVLPTTTPSCV
jgi:hypothetical protein